MLKTGELLMLSTEQYSDWNRAGPFKVLKDFDIHEVAEMVSKMPPLNPAWPIKNGPDDVVNYLVEHDFIELLPCYDFHLGSYGDINVTPEKTNV